MGKKEIWKDGMEYGYDYKGELDSYGEPCGFGIAISIGDDNNGKDIKYEGTFLNGKFDGFGVCENYEKR